MDVNVGDVVIQIKVFSRRRTHYFKSWRRATTKKLEYVVLNRSTTRYDTKMVLDMRKLKWENEFLKHKLWRWCNLLDSCVSALIWQMHQMTERQFRPFEKLQRLLVAQMFHLSTFVLGNQDPWSQSSPSTTCLEGGQRAKTVTTQCSVSPWGQ